ncbi:MAG: hypothetical protein ACT4QD_10770 [Acidobacteriota bacterium]
MTANGWISAACGIGAIAAASIWWAGCGPGCSPLGVTAEGQPVETFRGFAARIPDSEDGGGYIVAVFNHPDMDCETFLAAGRKARDDELMVRVYYTRTGRGNISVNFSNDMGRRLALVRAPRQVGETVEICLDEPSVHTGPLAYQRRRVVVQGRVSGVLCGEATR